MIASNAPPHAPGLPEGGLRGGGVLEYFAHLDVAVVSQRQDVVPGAEARVEATVAELGAE